MQNKITYRYSFREVKNKLVEHGIKATQQRIVVYEALLKMPTHPTAEQIYEAIKLNNPSISLATVYKTLDTFVNNDLAVKVLNEGGNMRYDANMDTHHHIFCTNTNEIIDYEDQELRNIIESYLKSKNIANLEIQDFSLQINAHKVNPEEEIKIN